MSIADGAGEGDEGRAPLARGARAVGDDGQVVAHGSGVLGREQPRQFPQFLPQLRDHLLGVAGLPLDDPDAVRGVDHVHVVAGPAVVEVEGVHFFTIPVLSRPPYMLTVSPNW